MPYKVPYEYLPDLGTLQTGDILPSLRPPFQEGSTTVGQLTQFVKPYKAYRVDMTQVSTNDPSVDYEYENDFGTIVWTYVSAGVYNGFLSGAFAGSFPEQNGVFFNLSMGTGINYYNIIKIDADNIRMTTKDKLFSVSDDLLKVTFINFIMYA